MKPDIPGKDWEMSGLWWSERGAKPEAQKRWANQQGDVDYAR